MDPYILVITIIGLAALGMTWLPNWLAELPLSYPILYLLLGILLYSLPLELPDPDLKKEESFVVRLTELSVIITLMGTGIKINRPFSLKKWSIPLRLVTVTMIVTIAAVAFFGWWALGLVPASAILLGAVLAPTDPVLAGDVQVGPPSEEQEDHVRFSLTAEAGLNDGMAFPFTWLAINLAIAAATREQWLDNWFLKDVLYKITAGAGMGYLMGRLLAFVVFRLPKISKFPEAKDGFLALSATLLVYGLTEMIHGYGFIAVFVAGLTLSSRERQHKYHKELHDFTDQVERLLMVIVLIPFGGSLLKGLLDDLTWPGALLGLGLLFIIRPLASMLGLIGTDVNLKEKLAISFFGIRGIGSFYYLAFAFYQTSFTQAGELWSIVSFVVVVSIVLHGITAFPVMRYLDLRRLKEERANRKTASPIINEVK
ncbi:sodium:proton antiporter [Rhodocytophaga rosea]|uniref:Sodium:proton antiporter n=1 Tax=Rhodocytophaga rosea TaxID=2704465 RepID=A0A6C0GK40_9BACT|nr:cation:proton antiporter [Rhodocytophaga rosea]QHT68441.1 sodium:proton antiporter [Rhodocytophaga rosea]